MAKYIVRPPFAVHLAWFETQEVGGQKRKIRREQSYFYSKDPVELNDVDAIEHMHKLEPVDAAAKKLFGDLNDAKDEARTGRQSQDGNGKSIATQVTEAMIAAQRQGQEGNNKSIAEAVIAALLAAGVIKPKEAKA
jgi:hypothetical protein